MADSLRIETKISTTTARLGDLIGLEVSVHHPAYIQVTPLAFPESLGTFEVFASTVLPVERSADQATTRFQAQLQNFTTGPQLLPPIPLTYRDLMDKTFRLQTSSVTVTIQPVPPDPKANGDILGIRGVLGPVGWSPWWWLLLASLLIALCFLLWRKRQRAQAGPPPPPPEPADLRALRRFKELTATGWLEAGKLKEFYSGISDILRGYLEDVFRIQALERTTGELLRDLRKKTELSSDQQATVRDVLEMCDLAKFAKFKPDAEEAQVDLRKAVALVEATRRLLHKEGKP